MGLSHKLSDTMWNETMVCDDHEILGTVKQSGVECALYVCAQAAMLANNCRLNLLEVNDNKEKTNAGMEMRRRMVLTLFSGQNYLEPNLEAMRKMKADDRMGRLVELRHGTKTTNKRRRTAD